MKKIISIDHGNRLIKTANESFPASFLEDSYLPSIGGDVLKYEGKTYTLVDQILPVQNDKTEDERYFILTLFAIGKELAGEAELMSKLTPNDHIRLSCLSVCRCSIMKSTRIGSVNISAAAQKLFITSLTVKSIL